MHERKNNNNNNIATKIFKNAIILAKKNHAATAERITFIELVSICKIKPKFMPLICIY